MQKYGIVHQDKYYALLDNAALYDDSVTIAGDYDRANLRVALHTNSGIILFRRARAGLSSVDKIAPCIGLVNGYVCGVVHRGAASAICKKYQIWSQHGRRKCTLGTNPLAHAYAVGAWARIDAATSAQADIIVYFCAYYLDGDRLYNAHFERLLTGVYLTVEHENLLAVSYYDEDARDQTAIYDISDKHRALTALSTQDTSNMRLPKMRPLVDGAINYTFARGVVITLHPCARDEDGVYKLLFTARYRGVTTKRLPRVWYVADPPTRIEYRVARDHKCKQPSKCTHLVFYFTFAGGLRHKYKI